MLTQLMSLFAAAQLLLAGLLTPEAQLQALFKTGVLLRLHVVAQDDTEEMQALKLRVRDAVQQCYNENCPEPSASMLENTQALLPLLAEAAGECARENGFPGEVRVELTTRCFEALPLSQNTVPAGEYPALMVYLGDAQGHNWWGLIDPEAATRFAAVSAGDEADPVVWDWSWRGFFRALLGRFFPEKEGVIHAP